MPIHNYMYQTMSESVVHSIADSDRKLLPRIFEDTRVEAPDGAGAIIACVDDDATDLRQSAARRSSGE